MNSLALKDLALTLTQFFSSPEGGNAFLIMVAVAIISFTLSATLFRRVFLLKALFRLLGATASLGILVDAALSTYQLVQAFN